MKFKPFAAIALSALVLLAVMPGCNQAPSTSEGPAGATANIAWIEDFNAALAKAKQENKPVLVDFYATWCGPCKMMDAKTYSDATVAEELKHWISVKIDVDRNQALARQYDVRSIPTTVLLDPAGKTLASESGFMDAAAFTRFVQKHRS